MPIFNRTRTGKAEQCSTQFDFGRSKMVMPNPGTSSRTFAIVFATWIVLAAIIIFFAKQNLSVPGLYYDEAVFAGMAKDFVVGQSHGQHMPDHETAMFGGRPFPLFVQTYLGALKSWMLIPAFQLFG